MKYFILHNNEKVFPDELFDSIQACNDFIDDFIVTHYGDLNQADYRTLRDQFNIGETGERYAIIDDVDGIDTRDYPDFVDAFVTSAHWSDTGIELTDDELEEIDSESVYNAVINRLY
jgi:hypothetical protein